MAGAWWTGEKDQSETHALFGYAVLALILFRIAWGLVGSETARFSSFVRGPSAALDHLRQLARPGRMERHVGHNAIGGYAVLLLLLSLLVEAVTGLFLYDDEAYWAPFNGLVSEEMVEILDRIHHVNFDLLLVLVSIHVAAILFYLIAKGLDLIRPMISGRAELPAEAAAPRMAPLALAALVAAVAIALVWALVAFAPI